MTRAFPALISLSGLLAASAVPSQTVSVVPAACAELPGNAALSLPLRWSEGTLQVRINSTLLPAGFIGQTITGLRLRRPTFLGEPAYPALQRTLTIRGGFDGRAAALLTQSAVNNRPPNPVVLFGPAPVSVPATAAPGAGTQVGDEFVAVQFTTPLPVIAGNLFLEFTAGDGPFQVGNDHWIDAVWFDDGVENGYAVTVGSGSCTSLGAPTELAWNDPATGPVAGGSASFRMTGAEPGVFVALFLGLDPIPRAAGPLYVGFGGSLTLMDPTLAGCHQWAPLDALVAGLADPGGSFDAAFTLVQGVTTPGMRVGVQSIWLDLSRPGLPISASNGVMLELDGIGVGNRCASAFFPGTVTYSPWLPYVGQMPVIVLEHL